ncbi:hypothetical protein ACJMK2_025863, partial [Sinanodonta woodiana]
CQSQQTSQNIQLYFHTKTESIIWKDDIALPTKSEMEIDTRDETESRILKLYLSPPYVSLHFRDNGIMNSCPKKCEQNSRVS